MSQQQGKNAVLRLKPTRGNIRSSAPAPPRKRSNIVDLTTPTPPETTPEPVSSRNRKRTTEELEIDEDEDGDVGESSSVALPSLPTRPKKRTRASAASAASDPTPAEIREWERWIKKIENITPILRIYNNIDNTSPPSMFIFITQHHIGIGVQPVDKDAHPYCDCLENNGRHMGCEYTICGCLQLAAINTIIQRKMFPYFAQGDNKGCLRAFYLNSRYAIMECNPKCTCGDNCKTKVVQKGRQVALEIFKTLTRGWGLRALVDLQKGQFIDTYRGEVITSTEADRREESAARGKDNYLFTLDKFAEDIGNDDLYVVDGEHMGGPTRFMNHSCNPNCRQYTALIQQGDLKIYELPFFALEDIPAGTELTFNYLDNEEEPPMTDEEAREREAETGNAPIRCLCGEANCRKYLWT